MNGSRARAFRRQAEDLTIGQPLKQYQYANPNSLTITLTPNCTRKVYQQLKRGVDNA